MRLGGLDDDYTGKFGPEAHRRGNALRAGRQGPLDATARTIGPATPKDVTLILAGHTHCGQIKLPIFGAISYVSKYGKRFGCGLITEGSRRVVVTAGIGTSVLPFRLGAPSDVWLLTLKAAEKLGDVRAQRVDRIAAFHHDTVGRPSEAMRRAIGRIVGGLQLEVADRVALEGVGAVGDDQQVGLMRVRSVQRLRSAGS